MDSPADSSNPPAGATPDEHDTSQIKAVPATSGDVVWPDDPYEADGHAAGQEPAAASPEVTSPAIPVWPESQSGAPSTPPGHAHPEPLEDDPHTAPFPTQQPIASWPPRSGPVGKTQPPAPAAAAHDNGTEDTKPPVARTEEVLKTAPPAPAEPEPVAAEPDVAASAPPVAAETAAEPAAAAPEPEPQPAPGPQPQAQAEPAPEPEVAAEPESPEYEAEPRASDEPVSEPDMPATVPPASEPVAATAAEPTTTPAPVPEAAPAPAPPQPAAPEQDPLAAEAAAAFAASSAATASQTPVANPEVPAWAPKFGAAPEVGKEVQWPGSNLPSWAPIAGGPQRPAEPERVRITSTPPAPQPAASQPIAPQPVPPAAARPAPPPAPQPAPAAAPVPSASKPPAPATGSKPPTASWEIVQQKQEAAPAFSGPSPEDKSYAEWFAWAKRSGAPASACHAAAQGAFRALSGGQDMATAVKWATLAMAQPPGLVSQSRQLYCAWFSLGNIDLQLPTPQAHVFATGAIQALESGADSMVAHQMGLQAAGITPRA